MANFIPIPEWKPLDFSGVADIPNVFLAARKAKADERRAEQNAETQKLFAENARQELTFKRESAQRARETATYERDVQRSAALPALLRAARQSAGLGNAMGQPYGVSFEQGPGVAPSPPSGDLLKAAGNAYGPSSTEPPAFVPAEGPVDESGKGPEAPPPEAAAAPVADATPSPVEQAMAHLETAKPHLRAHIGQRAEGPIDMGGRAPEGPPLTFDVPDEAQGTGLDKKYQAVFEHATSMGLPEEKAFQLVVAMKEKDDAQAAIAARTADQIKSREGQKSTYALTAEQTLSEHDKNRATSERNADVMAHSRVAAAAPGLKQESANDRAMSLIERRAAAVKNTAQFTKLAANDKTLRGLSENLASTETLPHKDAMIQVARIFRQAQPTEGEMHLLYNSLGGWADKPEQFIQKVMNGDLSPEQLRQLQASAKIVIKEHEEDKKRFRQVAGKALGPGSGFEQLPDQAQAQYDSLAAELGIEGEPPLYSTEGGVTVGTGKAPKVHAKVHPAEAPVGTVRPGPDGRQMRKVGPNNWQPVSP